MPAQVAVDGIHHLALVVTDLARATAFYQDVLGFGPIIDMGTRVITSNGNTILALTLASGEGEKPQNDRFDENRTGLDHLSFAVASLAALENAVQVFDAQHIPHGEIKDLGPGLPIYVLAFRDPDNIQLELTAPHG